MRGLERRLFVHSRGYGLAYHIGQFYVTGCSNLYIAEAHKGAGRVIALSLRSALQGIGKGSFGTTEILGINRTCRTVVTASAVTCCVRHLTEAETQSGSGFTLCRIADPSGSILTQVYDSCLPGLELEAVLSGEFRYNINLTECLAVGLCPLVNGYGLGHTRQGRHRLDGWSLEGTDGALEIAADGCFVPVCFVEASL